MAEPLIAATAGPFELLVPCAYAAEKFRKMRPDCTGVAVDDWHMGGPLCENCSERQRRANRRYDTFQSAYHSARARGLPCDEAQQVAQAAIDELPR